LPMTLSLLFQTARHYQGRQSKLATVRRLAAAGSDRVALSSPNFRIRGQDVPKPAVRRLSLGPSV
jgi:hypothetical protein